MKNLISQLLKKQLTWHLLVCYWESYCNQIENHRVTLVVSQSRVIAVGVVVVVEVSMVY